MRAAKSDSSNWEKQSNCASDGEKRSTILGYTLWRNLGHYRLCMKVTITSGVTVSCTSYFICDDPRQTKLIAISVHDYCCLICWSKILGAIEGI